MLFITTKSIGFHWRTMKSCYITEAITKETQHLDRHNPVRYITKWNES